MVDEKKVLGHTLHEWTRIFQHAPLGIIAPLLALVEPYGVVFGVCFLALCLSYQFIQEYQNKGKSHYDVAGIIVGLPPGVLALWLITQLG